VGVFAFLGASPLEERDARCRSPLPFLLHWNASCYVVLAATWSVTNPGGASKQKSTARAVLFCLERCVPPRRNVMRTSCVMLPLAVMCASRVSKEHITSLCAKGAIHHYGEAITSLRRSRYITLYKRSKLCYDVIESEVLPWLNLNSVNYQWNFPLILLTLSNS